VDVLKGVYGIYSLYGIHSFRIEASNGEHAIHSAHDHGRYLSAALGTLMDPAYLRRAIGDFGDRDAVEQHAATGTFARWRARLIAGQRAVVRRLVKG
jgi:hypothetical protein